MESNISITNIEERLRKIEIATEVSTVQYQGIVTSLKKIQEDIEELKNIPNRRQEEIISKAISTIVGVLVGGIIALVIKK